MHISAATIARVIVVGTAITILAVMGTKIMTDHKPHVEVNRGTYPTRGIDISAHNGPIDFDSVAADGIDFVYIKATEGATWQDTAFITNYSAATAAGLRVGIYHFFRFDVSGWRQSVNILTALSGRSLDLPIAIDLEEWSNPAGINTERIVSELRSLIELLRRAGRQVIIYTNKNGYYRFVRGRFDDVGLWICSFTEPAISDRERWTLWQHSHAGRVAGISGPVDLSTFNHPTLGSYTQWIKSRPAIIEIDPKF